MPKIFKKFKNKITNLTSFIKRVFKLEKWQKDILKSVRNFHDKVINFSSFTQTATNEKHANSTSNQLSRGVFFKLHAYAIVLHRAIISLCDDGWSQVTPLLLRVMFDVFANLLVIEEKDSEYRAFKYFYFFQMKVKNDQTIPKEEKLRFRKEIEEGLDKLDASTRKRGEQFINQNKFGSYWFNPEYKSPSDVLKKLSTSEVSWIYKTYSGASHGGHVGSSIYLDEPDKIDINERSNPKKANLAVMHSCRCLLDICGLRNQFEDLGLRKIYLDLLKEFNSFKEVVK